MLLKYQTYLLYDIKIKLESADAFEAINYFLDKVEGNIPYKFFRFVTAYISYKWIDLYNKFMKQYLEKGFKIDKISTEIKDNDEEEQDIDIDPDKLTLELFDYETCPKSNEYSFQIVGTLDTDVKEFTIEDLNTTNFLYHTILVAPETLKMLYDVQYEFHKEQVKFTQNI